MVKILNGQRQPEAAAGSLLSGWLMRPPKHDGQRVVPLGVDSEKRNFLLGINVELGEPPGALRRGRDVSDMVLIELARS
jgi:hypothetical protein